MFSRVNLVQIGTKYHYTTVCPQTQWIKKEGMRDREWQYECLHRQGNWIFFSPSSFFGLALLAVLSFSRCCLGTKGSLPATITNSGEGSNIEFRLSMVEMPEWAFFILPKKFFSARVLNVVANLH